MSHKMTFNLTLFDDAKKKEEVLNRLEIMFDDERNNFDDDENWKYFTEDIPYGSTVKITIEELKDE